jgi:hypothetical protein
MNRAATIEDARVKDPGCGMSVDPANPGDAFVAGIAEHLHAQFNIGHATI